MTLFNAGVIFENIGLDVYEVYCNVCNLPFGTMTGDGLARAIAYNRGRGGVMCPNCRGKICTRCYVGEVRDGHKLCPLCELLDDLGERP